MPGRVVPQLLLIPPTTHQPGVESARATVAPRRNSRTPGSQAWPPAAGKDPHPLESVRLAQSVRRTLSARANPAALAGAPETRSLCRTGWWTVASRSSCVHHNRHLRRLMTSPGEHDGLTLDRGGYSGMISGWSLNILFSPGNLPDICQLGSPGIPRTPLDLRAPVGLRCLAHHPGVVVQPLHPFMRSMAAVLERVTPVWLPIAIWGTSGSLSTQYAKEINSCTGNLGSVPEWHWFCW